ncbi:MAG: YkgJ family cysteine cluster protein [Candidatus Caenarcaniphilales bacterium]|nr:YkgJ family cysteine cluster protein [Candidatus Caenarcaniphilales bacterium]
MDSLDSLKIEESGCADFNRDEFNDYYSVCIEEEKKYRHRYSKNFRKFAKLLIFEEFSDFENQILERPENLAEKEIKILSTFVYILQGKALPDNHFIPSFVDAHTKKRLSQGLAKLLIGFFHILKINIVFSNQIQQALDDFDFFSLKEILPDITFYYSQYILEFKVTEKYDQLAHELLNFEYIDFCDGVENIEQRQEAERVRLLAFYYRVTGDKAKSEEYMMRYRKIMPSDITVDLSPEMRPKSNPSFFPATETLKNWGQVLEEVVTTQKDVLKITGLHEDTCAYFNCSDCCNYTSPHMSLTEYLYLKEWAEENDYPLEEARERAREIQAEHKTEFGEELKIIDKSIANNSEKGKENPHGFKYSCPFLVDKRCSIYEARPLLCRGFGLSSDDNLAVKTCNFYLGQYTHNCSRDNERYVYDLRPVQLMATESDRYLSKVRGLDKVELKGTIVSWLSQNQY